jgi:predicted secreted hydrolase
MGKDFFDFDDVLKNFEQTAVSFFEVVADTIAGKPENLRDGSEYKPVELPSDLAAHRNAQTEWWYYTGHCKSDSGENFGFELVFFKRRTDLDKFSLVPLRIFGNPLYFAHFAITEIEKKRFRYAHRKSANGLLDFPATASEQNFYVRLGDWSLRESNDDHILRATLGNLSFEATLTPTKKVVLNGKNQDGVSFKDENQASRYFSYTRMRVNGFLSTGSKVKHFSGSAWMDREFGTWFPTEKQKGWDWFSIQLENNTELMCYQLRDSQNRVSEFSCGTFVDEEGNSLFLSYEDFSINVLDYWISPNTGAKYPSGWKIEVPKLELELTVIPILRDQELDTRGTTMIIYWEGACEVKGKPCAGKAYVELVGYDRSHEKPNLAFFLMGNEFIKA